MVHKVSWGDFLPWDLSLKQKLPSEGETVSYFMYKSTKLWYFDFKKIVSLLLPANFFPLVSAAAHSCILVVETEK